MFKDAFDVFIDKKTKSILPVQLFQLYLSAI